MLITEITAEECREILARTGFGHLACSHNNEPYVVPMYFAYETDYLYGFSIFGRKIEWMRANPKVCIEVDEVASHSSWTSVIINGRYQELPNTPQHSSERRHAYSARRREKPAATKAERQRLALSHQPRKISFLCSSW